MSVVTPSYIHHPDRLWKMFTKRKSKSYVSVLHHEEWNLGNSAPQPSKFNIDTWVSNRVRSQEKKDIQQEPAVFKWQTHKKKKKKIDTGMGFSVILQGYFPLFLGDPWWGGGA